LIGNYGPKLTAGEKVGLVVKFVDSKLQMYFFLNGKPFCLTFDVPDTIFDGIFPVVKFTGKGSVKIDEKDESEIPAVLEPVKLIQLDG